MQGEIYTEEPYGTTGLLTESYDKLINETAGVLRLQRSRRLVDRTLPAQGQGG